MYFILATGQTKDPQSFYQQPIIYSTISYPFFKLVPKLRKRRRIEELEAEVPVAIGYWGKPAALEGAKYDFLCIQATLKSNKPDSLSFVEGEFYTNVAYVS